MKPHSSFHALMSPRGSAGIDLMALGAAKDPALADTVGQDFASIMALQLSVPNEGSVNMAGATLEAEAEAAESEPALEASSTLAAPVACPDLLGLALPPRNPPISLSLADLVPTSQTEQVLLAQPLTDHFQEHLPVPTQPTQWQRSASAESFTQMPNPPAAETMPLGAMLEPISPPKPKSLALTMANMLARAPESAPSTLDTFRPISRTTSATQASIKLPPALAMDEEVQVPFVPANAPMATTEHPALSLASRVNSQAESLAPTESAEADKPTGNVQAATTAWMPHLPAIPTPQPTASAQQVTALMQHSVGSAAFEDELVGHVNLWVKGATQSGPMTAELHLNPADMGPVHIRIELDGSTAQVNFVAHHVETRQAIEASFASLSNALQDAGIQLSGSVVSDQAPQQQAASGFGARGDNPPQQGQAQPNPQLGMRAPAPSEPQPDDLAPWTRAHSAPNASGLDLYA